MNKIDLTHDFDAMLLTGETVLTLGDKLPPHAFPGSLVQLGKMTAKITWIARDRRTVKVQPWP